VRVPQGRAFGTFHQADDFGFLVDAIHLRLARHLVGGLAFFAALALFVTTHLAFGCGASGADAFFSDSVVLFISFLLTGLRS
jgi:hypothetical protein